MVRHELTPAEQRQLLLVLAALLLLLACGGSASIVGTTSRVAYLCPDDASPLPRSSVAFRETVELAPFRVWATVGYGVPVGTPPDQQLALVTLRWHNPTSALTATTPLTVTGPVSITYRSALRITAVDPWSGPRQVGDWRVSADAVALHGQPLEDTIPDGDSQHTIPILIPDGQVDLLELTVPYLGPPDGDPATEVVLRFSGSRSPATCP
jgi:hypothetical protein